MTRRSEIAKLNDEFRKDFTKGRVVITSGVAALPAGVVFCAVLRVATFKDFNEDNDPHKEHDFGSFTVEGEKVFWKIDYYDLQCRYGSEDPSDPKQTRRVLTIMLAEEY